MKHTNFRPLRLNYLFTEIKEMENYIALYDKTLMSRWEKIRSSAQKDVVESFIQDLKVQRKNSFSICVTGYRIKT